MPDRKPDKDRKHLAVTGNGGKIMGRTGVEPATHGFSVRKIPLLPGEILVFALDRGFSEVTLVIEVTPRGDILET